MHAHAAMNRIYRLVWNEVLGAWVAVAENARGRGKRAARALTGLALVAIGLLLPVLAAPPASTQLPTGGQVVAGSATLAQSGARLDINQISQRSAIDWQSFNVGAQAQVNFNQPSSSAVTLNRVLDSQPSQIFGRITANGQVFLTNPNGVIFSPSASVDVGGLVATTHSISNADFMNGSNTFSRDGASGAVINEGNLNANLGGYIALLAPEVRNGGVIVANAGTVALAAGDVIELQFDGNNTLAGLRTTPSSIAALVDNRLAVRAPGGQIILSAQAVNQLQGGVVKNSGSLSATALVNDGGVIRLVADHVQLDTGSSVSANGLKGGTIDIQAKRVLQSGSLEASGISGGTINVQASDQILQTTLSSTTADGSSGPGGHITLQAGNTLFSSGTVSVQGDTGGTIHALGHTVVLAAADLNASGKTGGGTVLVGGDFQGKNPLIPNAQTVNINPSTQIKADAKDSGQGGKAIVWSDDQTTFYGHISAKGGAQAGNGGLIEVSGKQELVYGGVGDASAPLGTAGSLLLDPANIVISSAGSLPSYSFIDPNATSGGAFGVDIVPLASGNVVVTASQDTVGGVTTAGAVYLYNGLTGGLISALTGSQSGDQVGSNGITQLTNGNYVVSSPNWANGANAQAGAATWGSGVTGNNGTVSPFNSLVGSTAGDSVGVGVTALTNGNYVVRSIDWDNGAIVNAGAATWGNGSAGITGAVSSFNSLVGGTAGDSVGVGVTALTNGHYVVRSSTWDNGAITQAGAVTWGDGTTGITGAVSPVNSLVGSTANDGVGNFGVVALSNGHYVVRSSLWDNGAVTDAGAATWGNGSTGITGVVSAANSLVGTTASDSVSAEGVTALTNGNYVVVSSSWSNGAFSNAGAATWADGTIGITGAVSIANSLVGGATNNWVGSGGVTALTNGNYVVISSLWDDGATANVGAATWGSGTTGITGAVSAASSLVGSTLNDQVGIGGVVALTNGNYVAISFNWNNGAVSYAGAVTWGDGTTGTTGAVSVANSLVGSTASDVVGSQGAIALTNGNYVVRSPQWHNGAIAGAGAVTWGNGSASTGGAVSVANSLVGSTANDFIGGFTTQTNRVVALTNGNYVVGSAGWDNGAVVDVGAVTWGNGTTGITGAVSAANSLVGTTTDDFVGNGGITTLANGNYVVGSQQWNNGAVVNAGAATWGNGSTAITGTISAANSLLGTAATQWLGKTVREDTVNNTFVVGDNAGLTVQAGFADPNLITTTRGGGSTFTITPSFITNTLDTGTAVTLQATNNITINSAITAVGNGALTMQAGGSVTVNAPISVLGALTLRATDVNSSDITLNAAVSSTAAGDSVVLAAGRNFINTVGAGAIVHGAAGRFLVYSSNPAADTRGGLVYNFKQYNSAYGDAVLGSGDGFLYTLAPTITAGFDLASSVSKTYNGSAFATLNPANYTHSGAIDGDTVTLNNPASGSFDTKDAGVGKTVSMNGLSIASASNGAATVYGYQLASTTASAAIGTITPKALTLTGMTATNRVYDGGTSVVLSGGTLNGLVGAETLTFSGQTGAFADKNVGVGKAVTVSGVTLGDTAGPPAGLASNYTVSNPVGLTADITPRSLAISATGINRVYDGTTTATVTLGDDRVSGDVLTFGSSSSFADKNVGVGKAVSVTGISVGGADAGNYSANASTATTANITARTLNVSATGINRVYDGTTSATVTLGDDRVAGDMLSFGNTASFADKNVGVGKAVSVTGISVGGADAGNYSANASTSTMANISARTLNVSATGISRVYDGTTSATVTLGDDRVAGDVLSFGSSSSFADKNVGVGKAVSVTGISVGGADAGNYSANASTATTADITARTLNVSATGINRVYDGTTVATVILGDNRVAGDVLTLSNTSANFTDVNVGAGKTINVLGIGAAGTDAGNYSLSSTTATTVADILPVGTALLVGSNSSLIAPSGTVGLVVSVNPVAPLVSNPLIATVDPSFALPQAPNTGGSNAGTTANATKDDPSTQSRLNPSVQGGNTRRGFSPSALLFDAYGRPNSLDQLIQRFDQSSHHALRLDAQQSIDEMARSFLQSPLFGLDASGQGAVDTMGAIGTHAQQAMLTSMNEVWGQLDALKQQTERHLSNRQQITLGVTAGALVVSAGYLIWLLAGGSLAFLSLAFLPLWRGFDPLPVLDKKNQTKKEKEADRASKEVLAAERRLRSLIGSGVINHHKASRG